MLFGRRRHAAARTAPVTPAAPHIDEDRIYDAVQEVAARLLGEDGQWTVVARSEHDTDALFHRVFAEGVSREITAAVSTALHADQRSGDAVPTGTHAADDDSPADVTSEPAALDWAPAAITTWADLKRPVTGEVPVSAAAADHTAA